MSDFGTEVGNTSLNLTAKTLEALLLIFKKIFEAWENAPNRAEMKLRLQQAKTKEEKINAIKEIQGKVGYIKHKKLLKTGEPLTVCGIYLTKEEMRQFNSICNREGLLFSTVNNSHLKKEGEKAFIGIECRTSELERLRAAVDRFNDEKRQIYIEDKIDSIIEKKELSEQDHSDIKFLQQEKEKIQKKHCNNHNEKMKEITLNNTYDEKELKKMNISEALNRITGRTLDKDQHSIIADAINPDKFIKCHGYTDLDPESGKKYIKTDYEIYHGNNCILKTTDGRFSGRKENYWNEQKKIIEEKADFSGTYYKFYSENEYKKWAENVKTQNIQELTEMEKSIENKDYTLCIEVGLNKLKENGSELKESVLYDIETEKPINVIMNESGINKEKKALMAESLIIGKQIENYKNIQEIKNSIDLAKAEMILSTPGSKDYVKAKIKSEELEKKLANAYEKEKKLINERKNVNALQSIQQVDQENESQKALDINDKRFNMSKVKEDIKNDKNNKNFNSRNNVQKEEKIKTTDFKRER